MELGQLIQVKFLKNGLLLIFAPCLRRALASNYRPVSLTCIPCKLLEHIVCSNIMAHLDEHNSCRTGNL